MMMMMTINANIQTTAGLIGAIITVTDPVTQLVRVNAAVTGTLELAEKALPRLCLACNKIYITLINAVADP